MLQIIYITVLPLPRWSFLSPMEVAIKNMDSAVTWTLQQQQKPMGHVTSTRLQGHPNMTTFTVALDLYAW